VTDKPTRREALLYTLGGVTGTIGGISAVGNLGKRLFGSNDGDVAVTAGMPDGRLRNRNVVGADEEIAVTAEAIGAGLVDHGIQERGRGPSRASFGANYVHQVFASAAVGSTSTTALTSWFDFDLPSSAVETVTAEIDYQYLIELDSTTGGTASMEAVAQLFSVSEEGRPERTDGHTQIAAYERQSIRGSELHDDIGTAELAFDTPTEQTYRLAVSVVVHADTFVGPSFANIDVQSGQRHFRVDEVRVATES